MNKDITKDSFHRFARRLFWRDLRSAVSLYQREADLLRLIAWAKRKRLAAPHRLYEWRLLDTQVVLQRITLRSPQASTWAKVFFTFATMIFRPPTYKPRGNAAAYRRA